MKLTIQAALASAIVALAFATPVNAADEAPGAATPAKRVDCGKDAKAGGKEDCDTRTASAREPQTHKMVRCNEEAGKKQLRGDERRAFMSACLKG
ncbi:MAG TPA: PsiF family protein [Usitatibacter sp.]|nr:PsiF family protein [Usitatibacter sp.]